MPEVIEVTIGTQTVTISTGTSTFTPTGTGFRHVVSGVEDAAAKLVENADVHASAAISVGKIAAGSNDQVLTTTGGAPTWAKVLNANVDPSAAIAATKLAAGTNGQVIATTSGAAGWVSVTGDVTLSAALVATVGKVNGATAPAAGSLTTGNVLKVSGASALSYGAVDLGGGANHVTGTLPTGNQAAQTMGGDISGTTAAAVVNQATGSTFEVQGIFAGRSSGTPNPFHVKTASVDVASGDATPGESIYSAVFLEATGDSGGAGRNVNLPNTTGSFYIVKNSCTGTVTFKISGGTGVAVATGKTAIILHYGSPGGDYKRVTADV